jgi:uncharacterized protein (TIGR02145 family)
MKILGLEYDFVKVGQLEVATSNLYCEEVAIFEKYSNCCYYYHYFEQILEIDALLREQDAGVRVPSPDDFVYLTSLGSYWVDKNKIGNDIAGRIFGERADEITAIEDIKPKGCVFLPASGFYHRGLNEPFYYGDHGYYWSNRHYRSNHQAYLLSFENDYVDPANVCAKDYGFAVRCVRDLK